jgi:arylsulfatase A-like enzyme
VLFSHAVAPTIPTQPSHTTFYTGLDALSHRIVAHARQAKLSRRVQLLPQILQRQGYVTAAVDNMVTICHGKGSWFARGYDYYAGYTYNPTGRVEGKHQSRVLTNRGLELLDLLRREDAPFFFFIHYWDPHSPYIPPPRYDRMFYDGSEYDAANRSMDSVYALHEEYYRAVTADMRMAGVTDLDYVIAQYDAEIRCADREVRRLLIALDEWGLREKTLVVLVSDHGEAFGEGDFYFEHQTLYDAVVRIALVMRLPGVLPAGLRVPAMVSGADLAPTLLDLLGIASPPDLDYPLDGCSLLPSIAHPTQDVHAAIYLAEATRQASYAVRTARWKLIVPVVRDLHGRLLTDVYGRPRDHQMLLFDLLHDPRERHNVAGERPDVVAQLADDLENWRRARLARWGGPDPVAEQASGEAFVDALRKYQERSPAHQGAGDLSRPPQIAQPV